MLAVITFAGPLGQVPHALAAASGPAVVAVFPLSNFSNAAVQHFDVIFDESLTDLTEQQFMIDGSASGCQRVPFRASGVVFDVAVSGCSDGDIRVGVAANAIRDSAGNLGPADIVWSDFTRISHAAPNFSIGGLRENGGAFEFHLFTPTGILGSDAAAFEFDYPSCVASQVFYSSTDISYSVTGCPVGMPIHVKLEPYAFLDWYGNAGPASQLVSPSITLAAPVVSSPAPVPTISPTAVASATPTGSPSPTASASAAPATATIAQMLGLGEGPTPPDVLVTSAPQPATDPGTTPLADDSGLVTTPQNQDEPANTFGTSRATIDLVTPALTATPPPQIYRPVELKAEPANPLLKVVGGVVGTIGLAALAVALIKLRARIRRNSKRARDLRVAI